MYIQQILERMKDQSKFVAFTDHLQDQKNSMNVANEILSIGIWKRKTAGVKK